MKEKNYKFKITKSSFGWAHKELIVVSCFGPISLVNVKIAAFTVSEIIKVSFITVLAADLLTH